MMQRRALLFVLGLAIVAPAASAQEGPESKPPPSEPPEDNPAETKPPETDTKVIVEDATGASTTEPFIPGVHIQHVPVPIYNNFERWELWTMGTLAVALPLSMIFQSQIADWRFGSTLIGAPPQFDVDISEALWSGPDPSGILSGIDTFGGIVVPILAGAFYLSDGLVTYARGVGYTGDVYSLHHMLAFSEAFLFTGFVTQLGKLGVGRLRPEHELGNTPIDPDDTETYLSFPSGHTSTSFCIGSYLFRDLSDYLVHERGWGFWAGRMLPGAVIYGTAVTIAYQRVADQRHYFTDVFVGATVGTLIGHWIYSRHFDAEGHPRHNRGSKIEIVPGAGTIGVQGTF